MIGGGGVIDTTGTVPLRVDTARPMLARRLTLGFWSPVPRERERERALCPGAGADVINAATVVASASGANPGGAAAAAKGEVSCFPKLSMHIGLEGENPDGCWAA